MHACTCTTLDSIEPVPFLPKTSWGKLWCALYMRKRSLNWEQGGAGVVAVLTATPLRAMLANAATSPFLSFAPHHQICRSKGSPAPQLCTELGWHAGWHAGLVCGLGGLWHSTKPQTQHMAPEPVCWISSLCTAPPLACLVGLHHTAPPLSSQSQHVVHSPQTLCPVPCSKPWCTALCPGNPRPLVLAYTPR